MRKRFLFLLAVLLLLVSVGVVGAIADAKMLTGLALLAAVLVAGIWLGVRLFRRFLWGVGRKLAFSYFLIGMLPIPMVALLVGLAGFVLSGALVGHIFRDTLVSFHRELEETVTLALLEHTGEIGIALVEHPGLDVAYYRNGRLDGSGFEGAPQRFPSWVVEPDSDLQQRDLARVPFVLDGEEIRLAVGVETGEWAALGVYRGDLDQELRQRSGIWVQIERLDPEGRVSIQIGSKQVVLRGGGETDSILRDEFFGAGARKLWDEPILFWVQSLAPAHPLDASDTETEIELATLLNATPRTVHRQVVSSDAELDTAAWGAFLAVAVLLLDIYVVALLMAVFLIYGLSRAVNRLSKATAAVQEGDFSVRIPVQRKDQVGQMQRDFNQMAASLEELVASEAQKESLEKELQIARELQQNLLPASLTTTEGVELASYFEPSAAIGGDYFDLLRLDEARLAVVIADVSGHGLSAGLRMAMLKAALSMLVEQELPPSEIFSRLSQMVRSEQTTTPGRPLVTATLSLFDPKSGHLEIHNAGHPPTYLVRHREVQEIVLPSPPLGALGDIYASHDMHLTPGDVVIWLSDGLIEATDEAGDSFGYDRVLDALAGSSDSATEVRDRLLTRVAEHVGDEPAADDRTLVVMRYLARQSPA